MRKVIRNYAGRGWKSLQSFSGAAPTPTPTPAAVVNKLLPTDVFAIPSPGTLSNEVF